MYLLMIPMLNVFSMDQLGRYQYSEIRDLRSQEIIFYFLFLGNELKVITTTLLVDYIMHSRMPRQVGSYDKNIWLLICLAFKRKYKYLSKHL